MREALSPSSREALELLTLAAPEVIEEELRRLLLEARFALGLRRLAADAARELLVDELEDAHGS